MHRIGSLDRITEKNSIKDGDLLDNCSDKISENSSIGGSSSDPSIDYAVKNSFDSFDFRHN